MSWMNLSTYLSGLSETLKIEPASELFTKYVLLGYLICLSPKCCEEDEELGERDYQGLKAVRSCG